MASGGGGSHYEREFGLRPVVNCIGSMTSLGGSVMHPDAVAAMRGAAESFVDLNALLRAAGRRVAELARAPDGYDAHVVTGAAAAIAHCVAACLTTTPGAAADPAKVAALPNTSGFARREVLVDGGSDRRWERAAALTGAQVCVLGGEQQPMTAADLAGALRRGTACCVLYFSCGDEEGQRGKLPLREVLRAAHAADVPVVVDAAARVPPRSNLWALTHMGCDAVIFSGGKAIRGPQTSGTLIARQWLVDAARRNGSPNEPTVCRAMKCSKEDIAGFVAALAAFVAGDDAEELRGWEAAVERMAAALRAAPGVRAARRVCPGPPDVQPNHIPRLYVDLRMPAAAAAAGFMGDAVDHGAPLDVQPTTPPKQLAHRLAAGNPRIALNLHSEGIVINPQTMRPGDEDIVIPRILRALREMVDAGALDGRAARL